MEMILKKKSFAPWVKKLGGWEVFAAKYAEGIERDAELYD